MPFKLAPPKVLTPEGGAVHWGSDHVGGISSRGPKHKEDNLFHEAEDVVYSVSTESCVVAGVFDGHGSPGPSGGACPKLCAQAMLANIASSKQPTNGDSLCTSLFVHY